MSEQRPWHRLFAISMTDILRGTSVRVDSEHDLSQHKQLLDLLLVRTSPTPVLRDLPDGFEELATYNLVTFKSLQEPLDGWAIGELIGHYTNYRKQVSPDMRELLPANQFRLFAVCVRTPDNLFKEATLVPVKAGVYDLTHVTKVIRLVVIHELPLEPNNARFLAFSARKEQVLYAAQHFKRHSPDTSTLIFELLRTMKKEGITMPSDLDELRQQMVEEVLRETPPKKRLEGLSPEVRLEGLSPEVRLEGLSPEVRLEGLSPEVRLEGLSPQEMAQALSPEMREALARLLSSDRPPETKEPS